MAHTRFLDGEGQEGVLGSKEEEEEEKEKD